MKFNDRQNAELRSVYDTGFVMGLNGEILNNPFKYFNPNSMFERAQYYLYQKGFNAALEYLEILQTFEN